MKEVYQIKQVCEEYDHLKSNVLSNKHFKLLSQLDVVSYVALQIFYTI